MGSQRTSVQGIARIIQRDARQALTSEKELHKGKGKHAQDDHCHQQHATLAWLLLQAPGREVHDASQESRQQCANQSEQKKLWHQLRSGNRDGDGCGNRNMVREAREGQCALFIHEPREPGNNPDPDEQHHGERVTD